MMPDPLKTIAADKYPELHLFLDESGLFGSTNELMLVGGVLLFGKYDQTVQDDIQRAIVGALGEIGGHYPEDLHYNSYRTANPQKGKRFAVSLAQRLGDWRKRTNVEAYGVLIRHQRDIFSGSSGILAERELDNRYISMLWSLVEHFVFVNEKVSKRLTDNAAIHLHVANRVFPFPLDDEMKESAELLGWRVITDKNDSGQMLIMSVLNDAELRGMFRMTMRDRWRRSQRELVSVDVSWIQYRPTANRPESTPALYLADILLGVERRRMCAHTDRVTIIAQASLPILDSLNYDHRLESLSLCKSRIDTNDFDSILAALENDPVDSDDPLSKPVIDRLVASYSQSPKRFYRLFESALHKVDHPQHREAGINLCRLLDRLRHEAKQNDLLAELYTILISFSVANHTGNIDRANELWNQYLPLESRLPSLGPMMGMEMGVNFRCRRAVSLMDQFRFAEAEKILVDIGTREEHFGERMAEFFETSTDQMDRRRLGICYSTLGQACAFQSVDPEKRKLAEELFRSALGCFTDENDRERIWVYLAHLACDSPGESHELWTEVSVNLKRIAGDHFDGLKKPFLIAVMLKTVFVFGDADEKASWAGKWSSTLGEYPETILQLHPFGLIQQILAMIHGVLAGNSLENKHCTESERFFEHAIHSMSTGSRLLKSLAAVARIRNLLFRGTSEAEVFGLLNQLQKETTRDGLLFGQIFESMLVSGTIRSLPDISRKLADLIRFNYW